MENEIKGRIIFYNENNGSGLLITEEKKKYKFTIEDWDDFEHTPMVKQLVKFNLSGDKTENISTIEEEKKVEVTTQAQKQEITQNNAENITNEAPQVAQKPEFKTDEFMSKEMKRKIKNIALQVDVKTTIDKYFHKYKVDMKHKYKYDKNKRVLDYFKMKRFLDTAFNHLTDRDPDFGDDRLYILKQELEEGGAELKKFKDEAHLPKLKFEKIFLMQQDDYVELNKQMQGNKKTIDVYKSSSNSLASSLKRKEDILYSLDKNSNEYRRVEYDVKSLRRKYFDALDELGKIKKQNAELIKIKEEFSKKYYKDFLMYFTEVTEELDKQLTYIVFTQAYDFDTHMWMKARSSVAIRQFFIESQINGTFSSKTFLKYFLNSLDSSKLSHGNKELMKLLHYLESIEEKSILIVNEHSDQRASLRYLASGINKEYKVTAVNSPVEFYNVVQEVNPDIVFLDTNIKQFELKEFIDEVKNKTPKDAKIVVTSYKFTRKSMSDIKEKNIQDTLDLHLTESEIIKKLNYIIDENYRK
jgi:CheY-like chemotaxis protein